MKNSLHPFFLLFFTLPLSAQPCLPDGISFTTQQEIDDFPASYSGCTEIEGDIEITGTGITDLNGLSAITNIKGNLKIHDTNLLETLDGLNNLASVEGSLMLWGNNALLNLTGLEGLTAVQKHLAIGSNPDTCLCPVGNYALNSLAGLENLASVGGGLYIQKNIFLTDLKGLDDLATVGGDLMLGDNTMLASLTGLEGLSSIGGSVSIGIYTPEVAHGNAALLNLKGFDNLTAIGGSFSILHNLSLADISALNHPLSIGGDLTIYENTALPECAVQAVCDYLSAPNGAVDIHSNATGCNSSTEVEAVCTVGVKDGIFEPDWVIYPNPSAGVFVVKGGEGKISIRDAGGNLIQEFSTGGFSQIDLGSNPAGVYFVEIQTDKGRTMKKVIQFHP
ncbi:MAG: T9SS type A sorting domain-containing protein [Lewinellaceae bacterium]|nr:T9SS type A sorting domain-containing protein [Lewinellaceae bacterium]